MKDADCVEFLRWCLPSLRLRWSGFRKVRRTLCKRVDRQVRRLGLTDVGAYRAYLEATPAEWDRLDALCRIPISRFYRDRAVFDCLGADILPALAAAVPGEHLRAWSVGCASGEEPYGVMLLWRYRVEARFPGCRLDILAGDADPHMLERARRGLYAPGSLKDLPADLLAGFEPVGDRFRLREGLRAGVTFELRDIRGALPAGPFDLVLCRNLAFTYFDDALQRATLARLAARLRGGGALVIGKHEALPDRDDFTDWRADLGIFRRKAVVR